MNDNIFIEKMKDKMETHTIIKRNPEVLFSSADDEIVMMSVENEEYYGLNEIAARIWEILVNPVPVSKIVENLMDEYEIEYETCLADTMDLLENMHEKKLITLH